MEELETSQLILLDVYCPARFGIFLRSEILSQMLGILNVNPNSSGFLSDLDKNSSQASCVCEYLYLMLSD